MYETITQTLNSILIDKIRRYAELSPKTLEWVLRVDADTIREKNLLQANDPMSEYYRHHYPESWAMVEADEKGK